MDALQEVVRLEDQKTALEAQLKEVAAALASVKAEVLTEFEQRGMNSAKVNGHTVYLWHTVRAKCEGDRAQAAALLELYAPGLVRKDFNLNTVSAWVREQGDKDANADELAAALPVALAGAFTLDDVFDVRVTKG
jgi:hypothetical protein